MAFVTKVYKVNFFGANCKLTRSCEEVHRVRSVFKIPPTTIYDVLIRKV